MIFELMISIYLFTKKESIYFLNFMCIQFFFLKKGYLDLLYQKNLLQNFNSGTKIIFTCFYYKIVNFYNFIYKSISFFFSFKKSNLYKLLIYIYITLFLK